MRYIVYCMIKSFNCKHTQALFEGNSPKPFRAVQAIAERKLQLMDSSVTLESLRSPPGNRLEALKGDRVGQYSIRVNKQWRICFAWLEGDDGPSNLEIVDYH